MKKFENVKANIVLNKEDLYNRLKRGVSLYVQTNVIRNAVINEYGAVKSIGMGLGAGFATGLAMDAGVYGMKKAATKVKVIRVKNAEKKEAKNVQKVEALEEEFEAIAV